MVVKPFLFPISSHQGTPNRCARSAVVSSLFKAVSATLALNSGLYFFRLLVMASFFLAKRLLKKCLL